MLHKLVERFPYFCLVSSDSLKDECRSGAMDLLYHGEYLSSRIDIAHFEDEDNESALVPFHQEEGDHLMVSYETLLDDLFTTQKENCGAVDLDKGII